jgi:PAS domain S-box-containing protein
MIPMWIYDPDSLRFISVNNAAVVNYGYSRDQFLQFSVYDIIAEKNAQLRVIQDGIQTTLKADGTPVIVNITSQPVKVDGKVRTMITAYDITERVEKDIRLEQAVMRYETVAKATQDVIYDYEIAADKLLFYTDVTSLLEIHPDKVGSTKAWWRSFVHPDDVNIIATTQRQAMTNGETNWHCEYRMRLDADLYKYVFSQGYIIYNDDKQPVRIVGAVKDIDEFKRINEENKRLAEIITKINNMVVVMDAKHRITWINKAFEDYIGYTLNEVKGKEPGEFLGGPRINPGTLAEIFERKGRLETFSLDIKHYLKSGILQWVNVEYTPMFNNAGQHTGYIAVHRNITERKKREDQIVNQNKILQEISWSSSHEIRKPVASILALSQLANDPSETAEREKIITMIGQCAQELDCIVHNISSKVNNELHVEK